MTAIRTVDFAELTGRLQASDRMPVVFIGHGNPMNAVMDTDWAKGWLAAGKALPKPQAILCISAHWMSRNETLVNVLETPPTIHDFGQISPLLFEVDYPAPGAPQIARDVVAMLADHGGRESDEWGLDHGAWSVLRRLWPECMYRLLFARENFAWLQTSLICIRSIDRRAGRDLVGSTHTR